MIVAAMMLLLADVLLSLMNPSVIVGNGSQLYEVGVFTHKQNFRASGDGYLAIKNIATRKTQVSDIEILSGKTNNCQLRFSYIDGCIGYSTIHLLNENTSRIYKWQPVFMISRLDMLLQMPSSYALREHKANTSGFVNLGDQFSRTLFPSEFRLSEFGKISFAFAYPQPQASLPNPLLNGGQLELPPSFKIYLPQDTSRSMMFYFKHQDKVRQLKFEKQSSSVLKFPLEESNPWSQGCQIPVSVNGHFYVYQTTRNSLCLLDSNRQLYYITPIGGGAMVKKVSKLDYPVKIVYSGKTIDIFGANVSYHLDEHGELSSPGKTVWPTPKK
jgi:hypothetical protein